MLVAAVAAGFVGCKKTTNESETHSQSFTLGETSYSIDNAISILNIQYNGSQTYNAIVLSQGKFVGEAGGEGKGVAIVFRGDITPGTYTLSNDDNAFPKYGLADVGIDDIVNFDPEHYYENGDGYIAITGALTIEKSGDKYVITTDGIEVMNYEDNSIIATSSVDFEGSTSDFVLATVEEGALNNGSEDAPIVTAGTTNVTIFFIQQYFVGFITEDANMIGFTSSSSLVNGLPVGEFTNTDYPVYLISAMDLSTIHNATVSSTIIEKDDNDIYTINMTATIAGTEYTLHYVGTMPYFDFPF